MSTDPNNALKFPVTLDIKDTDIDRVLAEIRARFRDAFQQIINDWDNLQARFGTQRSPVLTAETIVGKYKVKATASVPQGIHDIAQQNKGIADSSIEIINTIEEIADEGATFNADMLESFKRIKKAIKPLTRQNKITALQDYFKKGGVDINDELQTMLGDLRRSQSRAEYKNILTAGRGRTSRSLLNNIKVFYKSLDRVLNPELATEIQAKRRELEKAIKVERQKKQDQAFKDQLKDIDLLSPADQISRLQSMRSAAVAASGKVSHIDREIKKRAPKADRVEWNRILNLVNTTDNVSRKLHWLNSIAASNVFAPKAKERAFQISGQRDSAGYRKMLRDISILPLQDQYNALQAYASTGAKHRNDALHEMRVVTERMKKADFADLFNRTKVMPISKQIDEFQKVLGTMSPETDNIIKAHIENLRKKLSSQQFKQLRTRLIGLDPDAAMAVFQQAVKRPNFGSFHIDEISALARRLSKNVRAKKKQNLNKDISQAIADERDRWESLVRDAAIMSREDAIRAFESYSGPNEFMKRARNRAHKLKTDVDYQEFMKESDRIKLLSPRERVTEIKKQIALGNKYLSKWKIRLKTSEERLAKDISQFRRERWEKIEKHVLSKDDDEQIADFTRLLKFKHIDPKTTDRFKLLMHRAQKRSKQSSISAARDRQRNFQNFMLNMSGIGLGLLGPAGFPLLNIGFSAMTGGPVGMAFTALATASGELYRAFSALGDQLVSVTKDIGLVGQSYKLTEARLKGTQGAFGISRLAAEKAGMGMLNSILGDASGGGNIRAGLIMQSSIGTALGNFIPRTLSGPTGIFSAIAQLPMDIAKIYSTASGDMLPLLREGLKSFDRQMMQGMPGIESDPYQTWLRIQNSALDPARMEERQYLKETRDAVVKQLKIMEDEYRQKELEAKLEKLGGKLYPSVLPEMAYPVQ